MNWYKIAQQNIKESLSRLSRPDLEGVSKKRIKLWNYLKSHDIKHTFYHGTAEKIYNNIKETGYMMSPIARQMENYERRNAGLDQIFYTTSFGYAQDYSKRASQQTDSPEVLLKLEIPIYLITEVRNAILNTGKHVYNEYDVDQTFNSVIKENLSEEGIWDIINHDLFMSERSNEFTTYMALPIKYITDSARGIDEIEMFSKEEWK